MTEDYLSGVYFDRDGELIECYHACKTEVEWLEFGNFYYNGAIEQALEVIRHFPNKPPGWNEGRDKIYEALKNKNEYIKTSKK